MIGCVMRKLVSGGKENHNEHLQTIVQAIMNDPRLGNLCQSGYLCIKATLENVAYSHVLQLKLQLRSMDEEIVHMTLGLTHVLKSYSVHINSVTLQRLLPEKLTQLSPCKIKCDLPLSWELSSLLSPTFHISEKSGKRIRRRSDC